VLEEITLKVNDDRFLRYISVTIAQALAVKYSIVKMHLICVLIQ